MVVLHNKKCFDLNWEIFGSGKYWLQKSGTSIRWKMSFRSFPTLTSLGQAKVINFCCCSFPVLKP